MPTPDPIALYREFTALRHVKRFQQMACVAPQSVAEHSFLVAMLAGAFARQLQARGVTIDRAAVVEGALWHDAAEAIIGDLPHQVKRGHPALGEVWDGLDRQACRALATLAGDPAIGAVGGLERLVIKCADWAELLGYVAEEQLSGNRALDRAAEKILDLFVNWLPQFVGLYGSEVADWYAGLVRELEKLVTVSGDRLRPLVYGDRQ